MKKRIDPFIMFCFLLLTFFSSCKKTNIEQPSEALPLIADGPMSPELGKRINLGVFGSTKYHGNIWGHNSNELFLSAETNLLRLDLSALSTEVLENAGGLFTGKTNENDAAIFIGTIRDVYGYYVFNFNSHSTERILIINRDQASSIAIAGNSMFVYLGNYGPPSNPCRSIDDIWCSSNPEIIKSSFYHVDRQTKEILPLPNKRFVRFSKDGRKTILQDNQTYLTHFFDNLTKSIEDSANLSAYGSSIYYDEVLKDISWQGSGNDILIENSLTHEQLDRFTSTANIILGDGLKWSEDGTKIYYMGAPEVGSTTVNIYIYDLKTKKEKTICKFSILQGGSMPIDNEFVLSSDNKRLLMRYLNDLYIKDVE